MFKRFGTPKFEDKQVEMFNHMDSLLDAYQEYKGMAERHGHGQLLAKAVMQISKFMDKAEDDEAKIVGGRIMVMSVMVERTLRLDEDAEDILNWIIGQDEESFKSYLKAINALNEAV